MKPEIDLNRLTAADLPAVLALSTMDSLARAEAMLALLDRTVEGGTAAIPFPLVGAYLKALDTAIGEAISPKD